VRDQVLNNNNNNAKEFVWHAICPQQWCG
jgi:hypothetical protein